MEIDMTVPADTYRPSQSRSGVISGPGPVASNSKATKRARSPAASPFDRPSKRPSIGGDTSICMPIARYAHASEDWVTQTRGLRIASPLIAQGQPGLAKLDESAEGLGCRNGESVSVVDATMSDGDVAMACSPPRRHGIDVLSEIDASSTQPPQSPVHLQLQHRASPDIPMLGSCRQQQYLTIPVVHIQEATPSPVAAPCSAQRRGSGDNMQSLRKQRFTMGPRADCEKCRMGVKGHWMHVD